MKLWLFAFNINTSMKIYTRFPPVLKHLSDKVIIILYKINKGKTQKHDYITKHFKSLFEVIRDSPKSLAIKIRNAFGRVQ